MKIVQVKHGDHLNEMFLLFGGERDGRRGENTKPWRLCFRFGSYVIRQTNLIGGAPGLYSVQLSTIAHMNEFSSSLRSNLGHLQHSAADLYFPRI